MNYVTRKLMIIAVLLLGLGYGQTAHATSIVKTIGVTSNDFDLWASPAFPSVTTADGFEWLSGSGYFHSHGKPGMLVFGEMLTSGLWTNIFTISDLFVASSADIPFSSLAPFSFAPVSFTQFRIRSNITVSQAFHSMSGTSFGFTKEDVPVPATASLAIFVLGLAGFGVMRRARVV